MPLSGGWGEEYGNARKVHRGMAEAEATADVRLRLIAASSRKERELIIKKNKNQGEKKDWIALGNNKWISSTTPRDLESTMARAPEHGSLQNICKKSIILRIMHILFWGQPPPPAPKPKLCSWVFNPRWRRRFSSRQKLLQHLLLCSIIRKAWERPFVLCELLPFLNFHFWPQLINFNHAMRFVAHSQNITEYSV